VTRSVESFKLVVAKFVIYPSLMKDGMLNTPGRVTAVKSHKIHSFGIQTAGLYPISFRGRIPVLWLTSHLYYDPTKCPYITLTPGHFTPP